jgi:hypothetical protein
LATLAITRNYNDGEVLTEADLDAICDSVETFLNSTKINDDNIQNSGITGSDKLVSQSVTTAKIADLNVTTAKINDLAVTTGKLDALAVTAAKLAADAVETAKILDANVTRAKLAVGAIGRASLPAAKTTTYTAASTDDVIRCDTSGGGWTLTLFSAASLSGRRLTIIKTTSDFNVLTIDGDGSETINGSASTTLNTQYESVTLVSDGTNWVIEMRNIPVASGTYTPTFGGGGFGTPSSISFIWRRERDYLQVEGMFTNGTVAASLCSTSLPSGLALDTNKISAATNTSAASPVCGQYVSSPVGGSSGRIIICSSSSTSDVYYGKPVSSVNANVAGTGTEVTGASSSGRMSVNFRVPISGWNG